MDRERLEEKPYRFTLCLPGREGETEPFEPLSDDIWHLGTECIEDHGDYVRIARRKGGSRSRWAAREEIRDARPASDSPILT